MPSGSKAKRKGGDKDSAVKNTFNPPAVQGSGKDTQTREPEEQDANREVGQFTGKGKPSLMKK
jgi:hypothetical protein